MTLYFSTVDGPVAISDNISFEIRLKAGLKNIYSALLDQSWNGSQNSVAYDTAWVANLKNNDKSPLFPGALRWLEKHQHDDGSWGGQAYSLCERMISTAATIGTLLELKKSHGIIENGISWMESNFNSMLHASNQLTRPVGFELLLPTMLQRIASRDKTEIFNLNIDPILSLQKRKLEKLPIKQMLLSKTPIVFSLEFLDASDNIPSLDHQISNNFSIGCSPSATAWYASRNPKTKSGLTYYLRYSQNSDGGWPAFTDFDMMTIPFVIYPIYRGLGYIPNAFNPVLQKLYDHWTPRGIGFSQYFETPDADDSALGLLCLYEQKLINLEERFWSSMNLYENQDWFATYNFEVEPSYMCNLHTLELFKTATNHPRSKDIVDKLIKFFEKEMNGSYLGADKYYFSPSFQNCHGIFAFEGIAPNLAEKSMQYFMDRQDSYGLWGSGSTQVEETAFAVLALSYYSRYIEPIDLSKLKGAVNFLLLNWNQHYGEQWITKVHYAPIEIIQAHIFAALASYANVSGTNISF